MTREEAETIIQRYEECEERGCSCHMGHPPCGRCENMPAPEEYEEALLVVEENAEKAPLTEAQQNTFNMLIERGAVHHPEDDLPNVVWFGNRCLYIEEDGGVR